MRFTRSQVVRSLIAVLGVCLLGVGGWQFIEHSGPRTVVASQESAAAGEQPAPSRTVGTASVPALTSPATVSSAASSPGSRSPRRSPRKSLAAPQRSTKTTHPSSAPSKSVPGNTAPGISVPSSSVPSTTVHSTTVHSTTVHSTTVHSTTVHSTTVPSGQVVPTRLSIPSIGIDASVAPAPTRVAYNQWLKRTVSEFGIPDDTTSVAWWSDGPPVGGGPGLAVLLGHTTIGGNGVFNQLDKLHLGDAVEVGGATSSTRLEVSGVVTDVPKTDATALQRTLQNAPAAALVALVTCSGDINPSGTSHADNTVVFLAAAG